jgi:molybdopterin-guanine dinucleotide biosynthesis protein A
MSGQVIENVSAILIAGGRSRRMGRDKRFLTVDGSSLFRRTLDVLKQTFSETIVVLAEPVDSLDVQGSRVVFDLIPNAGSLGGLYTGLIASSRPRIFAVACDMPFLASEVIRFMVSFDDTADVVVAELEGRFQPMHALYSQACKPFLQVMAERQDLKIQNLFLRQELRITAIGVRELALLKSGMRSFQNINTPDDLARAEAEIAGRS